MKGFAMSPGKRENPDVDMETSDADDTPRVIPLYQDSTYRAIAPFAPSATRRCYIRDPGPPVVLREVPCDSIVIIDHPGPTKFAQ
jgi:hypothetical protein